MGFWFSVYTYILILFPEIDLERLFVICHAYSFAVVYALLIVYIYMFGAADAQVSVRSVMVYVYIQ